MTVTSSAPVHQKERIQIIDSVRGVALLGILMMNIPFFSNPDQYDNNLNVLKEYSGPNFYTWFIVSGFFNGTMRALFSMLFGAGGLLLLSRLEKRTMNVTPADIYYRRMIILFLFGIINAFVFLWPGDILYAYALCGLFLYPLRNLKPKVLLIISLCFLLFVSAKVFYKNWDLGQTRLHGMQAVALEKSGVKLNEEQSAAKEKWAGYQKKTSVESLRKEAKKEIENIGQKGYIGSYSTLTGFSIENERQNFYDFGFYDIMICIFLGMALFKWRVLTGGRSKKFYWTMLALCFPIGALMGFVRCNTLLANNFDFSLIATNKAYMAVTPLLIARRIFLALGYLSILVLLYQYGIAKRILKALSAVGQMAFTNYLSQSIICAVLFYGFGFGLFGKLQRYQEYYVVGCIWVVQIIFSNIWLRYYQFGPFEWLWRSLTYWKAQPMKRRMAVQESEEAIAEGAMPIPA